MAFGSLELVFVCGRRAATRGSRHAITSAEPVPGLAGKGTSGTRTCAGDRRHDRRAAGAVRELDV
jgi:hypothetical protein